MNNDRWQHMFPHEPALQPNEFVVFTQESSGKRHVMRYDTVANRLTPAMHVGIVQQLSAKFHPAISGKLF